MPVATEVSIAQAEAGEPEGNNTLTVKGLPYQLENELKNLLAGTLEKPLAVNGTDS